MLIRFLAGKYVFLELDIKLPYVLTETWNEPKRAETSQNEPKPAKTTPKRLQNDSK